MPRHSRIPADLCRGPFTIAQAKAAGISVEQLRSSAWRRVGQGWYCWTGWATVDRARLVAIASSLPAGAGFSGATAAMLYGWDVHQPDRPEVVVPVGSGIAGRAQATVRRIRLEPGDVIELDGIPVTSPLRTCFDLGGRLRVIEATVAVDMALHAGLVDLGGFEAYVAVHHGVAGVVGARRVLELAEAKSESPMETRLRLLLVLRGLPRPEAQVELYDARGIFVARPDLYYPSARLAIEYDGENHRERMVADNRRQNALQAIGVQLLRYTGPDLRERPAAIVQEVRAALAGGPLPGNPWLRRAS